ncbi:MAG: D-aminoacylase, partial [Planctomycetes bacterium]|nr:D-aminoacylase [Planctomycetota bacterium]
MHRIWLIQGLACFLAIVNNAATAHATERFDLLLKNGKIVDGAGTPWYRGDIGLRDGKIAAIGRFRDDQAVKTLDVSGLIVAPGFIDMMGQTGSPFLKNPE